VATAAVLVSGSRAAARGERVLGGLDPLFLGFRRLALPLLETVWERRTGLGAALIAACAVLAFLALRKGLRSGAPVALGAAAAALATAGQLLLVAGRIVAGWLFYGAGVAAAAAAGALAPLAAVPSVPALPRPDVPPGPEERPGKPPGRRESAVLLALLLLALLTRAWALNELPASFDAEMISTQTQSRTAFGLSEFVRSEFVGTSNGVVTPLTNRAVYAALGTSITSMRVTALLWGLLAVGLFWGLARRLLAGLAGPAAATLLFVAAPEQLFWSRSEVSIFAPMAVIGLLLAHAGLSMTRRFRAGPVLVAALLTPVSRLFYTAAHVLVVYPFLLGGHALLAVKGAARRAAASLPVLALGIGLWILSVSAAQALVSGRFEFVHPARVRGEAAWRAGLPPEAGAVEVASAQASRLLANLRSVAAGLTYHEGYSTHWTQRAVVSPPHNTTIGMGLAILAAAGLGWLFGQPRDRRSALLLLWLGLGLLPGCLSEEPDARRNSVLFAPLLLSAGIFVVALVRLARERAGRAGGLWAAGLGGVSLFGVALAGFASHLLLPVGPLAADQQIRFAAPLFSDGSAVLHGLFYREGKTIAFGQLDRLLRPTGPCYQFVERDGLLQAVLSPSCDYREEVYQLTLPPETIAKRRSAAAPQRIGYLATDEPWGRRLLAILRAVHPAAPVRVERFPAVSETLFAVETDRADLDAARRPETVDGVTTGGFLLPRDGWWDAEVEPPCAGARLVLGADRWDGRGERPLLAGVHPFRLSRPAGCGGPARLVLRDVRDGGRIEPVLVAPRVAALPEARAADAVSVPAFGAATPFVRFPFLPSDVARDATGRVWALGMSDFAWQLVAVDAEGRETGTARPDLPRDPSTGTLALSPDGGAATLALNVVELYDAELRRTARWELPPGVVASDALFLPDGRLLVVTNQNRLDLFTPGGRLEESFVSWSGDTGRFAAPVGVALGPAGLLAVAEASGDVELFHLSSSGFPAVHLRTLHPETGAAPFTNDLRGIAFDGEGRLLLPYNPERPPLRLDLEGRRLLSATAAGDLSAKGFGSPYRFLETPEGLLVLDRREATLWSVARRPRR